MDPLTLEFVHSLALNSFDYGRAPGFMLRPGNDPAPRKTKQRNPRKRRKRKAVKLARRKNRKG